MLHRERGNLERAAQCYTAALQIRPNFPQVPRSAAPSPGMQHVAPAPFASLTKSLSCANHLPPLLQGLNNLAVVYTAQGRVAEALQLLQGEVQQGAGLSRSTGLALPPHVLDSTKRPPALA